jgi:hypothetical protein
MQHFVAFKFCLGSFGSLTLNYKAVEWLLVGSPLLLIQNICRYPRCLDAAPAIRNRRTRHTVMTRHSIKLLLLLDADNLVPLYPQKLALTSPTNGGRSIGIVRSRTHAMEVLVLLLLLLLLLEYSECVCVYVCVRVCVYCRYQRRNEVALSKKILEDELLQCLC